jgi:hypothetical protein
MTLFAAICSASAAGTALGQAPPELAAVHTGLAVASMGRDLAQPPGAGAPAPGQFVRPAVATSGAGGVAPAAKPFQFTPQRPTISPYLNLYRDERDDTLPNYFAFVLPQLQQQQFVQQQQLELARIHQQLQQASLQGQAASLPAGGSASGVQPHNYHARFMNTGGYFSGIQLPQAADAGQ